MQHFKEDQGHLMQNPKMSVLFKKVYIHTQFPPQLKKKKMTPTSSNDAISLPPFSNFSQDFVIYSVPRCFPIKHQLLLIITSVSLFPHPCHFEFLALFKIANYLLLHQNFLFLRPP